MLATDRCHHLDDPWRDGAVAVRFYEEQQSLNAILAAHAERPISGVIAVGDRPTVLAARVADALGIPGNPVDAAEASRSKKAMRECFGRAGMPTPWVHILPADATAPAHIPSLTYPCVVKPLGLSGSRGVIKVDRAEEFEPAVRRVRALLARPQVQAQRTELTDELLVEGYIEGREYAVEALLTNGRLRVLTIFDKPDPLNGPFFEETIYVTPPAVCGDIARDIGCEMQRATRALGLVHGPIHAECRVGPGGITMLEVAARPIGGLCARVLRFGAGGERISLEELLLRHALDEDTLRWHRETPSAGVMMIPIPRRGIFKGLSGEPAARDVPYVEDVVVTAKRDQLLEPVPEGDSYLGFIFARAERPDDVVAALREAHARLVFEIDPELRVIR